MSEEIALGQREVEFEVSFEFTPEELALLETNGVKPEEVIEFVRTSGKQTINAAIGGIKIIQAGQGQERTEPFNGSEAQLAEVSVASEAAPVEGAVVGEEMSGEVKE